MTSSVAMNLPSAQAESFTRVVVISSTNMIFFKASYPMDKVIAAMRKKDILMLQDAGMGRIVTSLNISEKDTDAIVKAIRELKEEDFR